MTPTQRLAAIHKLFDGRPLPLHREDNWRRCGCDDCAMDRKIYKLSAPAKKTRGKRGK